MPVDKLLTMMTEILEILEQFRDETEMILLSAAQMRLLPHSGNQEREANKKGRRVAGLPS